MKTNLIGGFLLVLGGWCSSASAQHLWWDVKDHAADTCLYGQVTVLATHENIYYCGANWHPGQAAGGYCGIQHNGGAERRTIFSIWDTTADLHPVAAAFDPRTVASRFGGEGEGGHTHMLWPWKIRQTFEFCVQKVPGTKPDTTDARYFVLDLDKHAWVHSATITSPNGGQKSVPTIGGGSLASFLENFAGKDKDAPKLATYRLWLGDSLKTMKPLTLATGDGTWGELHDAYFLAEGDATRLGDVFSTLQDDYGKPAIGAKDKKLPPISEKAMAPEVVKALEEVAAGK